MVVSAEGMLCLCRQWISFSSSGMRVNMGSLPPAALWTWELQCQRPFPHHQWHHLPVVLLFIELHVTSNALNIAFLYPEAGHPCQGWDGWEPCIEAQAGTSPLYFCRNKHGMGTAALFYKNISTYIRAKPSWPKYQPPHSIRSNSQALLYLTSFPVHFGDKFRP